MKFFTASNYGAHLEYELSDEDISSSRPLPMDLVEIDPPNWAVGATCKLGGRRHEKRQIIATAFKSLYSYNGTPVGPLASPSDRPLASDTEVYNAWP